MYGKGVTKIRNLKESQRDLGHQIAQTPVATERSLISIEANEQLNIREEQKVKWIYI